MFVCLYPHVCVSVCFCVCVFVSVSVYTSGVLAPKCTLLVVSLVLTSSVARWVTGGRMIAGGGRKEVQGGTTEMKRTHSKKLIRQLPIIPSIKEGEVLKTMRSYETQDSVSGENYHSITGESCMWGKPNLPRDRSLSLPYARRRLKLIRNCVR